MWRLSSLTENIWFLQGSYWNWFWELVPQRAIGWKSRKPGWKPGSLLLTSEITFNSYFFFSCKCVTVENTVTTSPLTWLVLRHQQLHPLWYSGLSAQWERRNMKKADVQPDPVTLNSCTCHALAIWHLTSSWSDE